MNIRAFVCVIVLLGTLAACATNQQAPSDTQSKPASKVAVIVPSPLPVGSDFVADVAESAAPSVVSIEISVQGKRAISVLSETDSGADKYYRIEPKVFSVEAKVGDGSGFIVDESGHIATNYHVINPNLNSPGGQEPKITVVLADGRRFPATVVGEDEDSDLAVIKISAEGLKPIAWGDSSKIRPGQFALTIGSSLGAEQTVGFGIISAVSRKRPQVSKEAYLGDLDYIQTYAQINPGNSGGPLIDLGGNVIGITTFIQVAPHTPGFAIPSNYASRVISSLITEGKVKRPAVGIYVLPISRLPLELRGILKPEDVERSGVLVEEVLKGGPADKAGLKRGDVIKSINGKPVSSPAEFTHEIRTNPVGSKFALKVLRDGTDDLNLNITSAYLE